MHPLRPGSQRATLITEAPLSVDDEFNHRRRRYLVMMTMRGVCVLGAAIGVQFSGWLVAAFLVGALVLPWVAVLLANDRPPRQAVRFRRFFTPGPDDRLQLENRPAEEKAAPRTESEQPAGPSASSTPHRPTPHRPAPDRPTPGFDPESRVIDI